MVFSVRPRPAASTCQEENRKEKVPEPARLPLRWAVIFTISASTGASAGAAGGSAVAVGGFFATAAALHLMLA